MTITELWKNYQSLIVLQLTMTSSSSLNYMTPPPSLRESLVRQISSKDNLGSQVCTPPKTPLPSTSGFVPRPTPTFQPIAPAASPEAVNTHNRHHTNGQQNAETSPESSLLCGQQTPIGSTSITSTPSQHIPPQSVVPP